jgi:hypothetical protein
MVHASPVARSGRLPLAILALTLVIAGKASAQPASLGECLTVEAPWPVKLPDDSVHAAATLQICNTREYSPVQFLEKVSVNGLPIGMFLSRTGLGEAPVASAPFVAFLHGQDGVYRLEACGWPEGNRTRIFFLRQDPTSTRGTHGVGLGPRRPGGEPPVLLAALPSRP